MAAFFLAAVITPAQSNDPQPQDATTAILAALEKYDVVAMNALDMLKRFVCLLFAALFMMSAQAPDETLPELRIEIMSIRAGMSVKYSATLERIQDRRGIGSADLAPNGFLCFRDVPYGEYRLTIISDDGTSVYQDQIAVNSST